MVEEDLDDRLRAMAFAYLEQLRDKSGGPASWNDLRAFRFEGRNTPLIGQTGIRRARPDAELLEERFNRFREAG